jgi:beta-glucanase (GH16 family)
MPTINPFSVSNGILTIRSEPHTSPNGKKYTSGVVTTFNSFNQTYGYFETRAKMPPGKGLWPAFWMLPRNAGSPPEFDIFEFWGSNPAMLLTTSHSAIITPSDSHCYPNVADMTVEFHTYGFEWNRSTLTWYFDGVRVCESPTRSDQNQPFYMILGSGVTSGSYAGTPDDANVWPSDLQIDYVRVWQTSDQLTSPNLALHHPVTASSVENDSNRLTQSLAVDGNINTRWSSDWSDPQWISIDLGAPCVLSRVVLNWSDSYARNYQIQVSDDTSTWTTIYSTTNGDRGMNNITVSGTGRFVRLYGTERALLNGYTYGYSLHEFEVYN